MKRDYETMKLVSNVSQLLKKFSSEINLQNKRSVRDKKRFMKVDAERRTASEKLETIVITTKGYNQNLRIAESKLITKYIIPETQLS